MFRKISGFLFVVVILGLVVSGCGSGGSPQSQQGTTVSPPAKPAVARTGGTTAALTWEASASSGIAGYYIYRGTTTEGSGLSNIGSTDFSVNAYSDSGLTSTQGYYYAVSAITSAQESQKSEAAYAEPYTAGLPIVISGVK